MNNMSPTASNLLAQEWTTLQNQFDSYEKYALLIKLFAITWLIVCCILSQLSLFNVCVGVLVCGIIWLQDAIWKTFQSRIETRILKIEVSIEENTINANLTNIAPCQFNRDFLENRPGTIGTLVAYLKQALRPTIAYPHIIIVLIMIALHFI